MQPGLSRKEQLELWRNQTGRTPMKRLSYVQKCWKDKDMPTKPTSFTPQTVGRKLHRSTAACTHTLQFAVTPANFQSQGTENIPSSNKNISRREMLEQWQAIHGSTVKKPRSYLQSKNGPETRILSSFNQPVTHKRRHTITTSVTDSSRSILKLDSKSNTNMKQPKRGIVDRRRKTLMELFQQDIDNTAAQITAEYYKTQNQGANNTPLQSDSSPHTQEDGQRQTSETICYDGTTVLDNEGGPLFRELSDDENASQIDKTTERKKRRSHIQFDEDLMFQSTAIRYSMVLSEPKRRHRRYTLSHLSTNDSLLYLTPVRRSTRVNRCGPGLALDRSLCFDSPTQANAQEIQVLPNKALFSNL